MLPALQTTQYTTPGTVPGSQAGIASQYTKAQLQGNTIPQLKEILKAQGKKVGGKKEELISRILGEEVAPIQPSPAPPVVTSPARTVQHAQPVQTGGANPLAGMVIAVTGTLFMKRDDIQRLIEANGGKFAKSVTNAVTHLVAKDPTSNTGKLQEARSKGITIVGEDFLQRLIQGAQVPAAQVPQVQVTALPAQIPATQTGTLPALPALGTTIRLPTVPIQGEVVGPIVPSPRAGTTPAPVSPKQTLPALPAPIGLTPIVPTPTMPLPTTPVPPSPALPGATLLTPIVGVAPTPTGPAPVAYDRYGHDDLINLARNMYGVDLSAMDRTGIVQWLRMRETMGLPPIVGAGPQSGALSPVVTAATQLPVLPGLPLASPTTATTGIALPALPTSPTQIKLPPIPTGVPLAPMSPVAVPAGLSTGMVLPAIPVVQTTPSPVTPIVITATVTSPPTSPFQLPAIPAATIPVTTLPATTLPALPPVTTPAVAAPIMSPMPGLPPLNLPSLPPIKSLKTLVALPTPTQVLPTGILPPIPPPGIRAALSPQPTFELPPITAVKAPVPMVSGVQLGMTELPPITAPSPTTTVPVGLTTGIKMPHLPTVVPSQAIRLPTPPPVGVPAPVPTPQVFQAPAPQTKVGPGGLPIDTDLATLNQLRTEINTAVNINPQAVFQRHVPAPTMTGLVLPPIANITLAPLPVPSVSVPPATTVLPTAPTQMGGIVSPMTGLPPLPGVTSPRAPTGQLTGLPQIVTSPAPQGPVGIPTQLPTQLPTTQIPTLPTQLPFTPGMTVPLPTHPTVPLPIGKSKGVAPKITLPRVKETFIAGVTQLPQVTSPRMPGLPNIRLPTAQTVMQPVALTSPKIVPAQEEAGLAVAYTPQQQVVENIMHIDPTRLNAGRSKKDDNSYDVKQLRAIAGSLNLAKSGNKKDLVERIKAKIISVNPNAFN